MPALSVSQAFALATEYHRAGRLMEAETLYRRILLAEPAHPEAARRLQLLVPAGQARSTPDPVENHQRSSPHGLYHLGNKLLQEGRLEESVDAYRRFLGLEPNLPEAHLHLGIALAGQRRFEEAAAVFRRALVLKPDDAEAHNNLGNVLKDQGRLNEAMLSYREALRYKPDLVPALFNLGTALKDIGSLDEATTYFQRVLAIRPDHGGAWNNLGNTLQTQGKLLETESAYRSALRFNPNHSEVHNNLANLLLEQGRPDEAIATFRQAIALNPESPEAHCNLGNAFKERGQLDEASAAYRHAVELWPANAVAQSNLIFALHSKVTCDHSLISTEHRRWNRHFGNASNPPEIPYLNIPSPTRRLRIGYLSPDFRSHPVSFFTVPLMEAHDRTAVELYCYSGVTRLDGITERLRSSADNWRDVRTLTDHELADTIRSDKIDILVDLAMHTAGNRLPALVNRPAPVQASWLAYPGSTGLECIDYRLTDVHIDRPADSDEAALGGIPIRLPDVWCCYSPILPFPEITPLPASQNGFVTFGSLNQFSKINDQTLRHWARLLQAVPDSRLILVCPPGSASEGVRALFDEFRISSDRIELVPKRPWAEYVQLFAKIDLALDSHPCNGMTTTCHALWMGLPVVTLSGDSAVSRAGASLLHSIGMPQWIARDGGSYVQLAAELARDIPRLAELRANLRSRMRNSTLMDAPRFARQIEAAYCEMWQRWCARATASPQ